MRRFAIAAMLLVPSALLLPATGAEGAEAGPVCMEECRCGGGQQSDLVVEVGPATVCVDDVAHVKIRQL